MTICHKRRDEFIGLLTPWYEMTWSKYFDLSDLQNKVRETFEVNIFIELISIFFKIYLD